MQNIWSTEEVFLQTKAFSKNFWSFTDILQVIAKVIQNLTFHFLIGVKYILLPSPSIRISQIKIKADYIWKFIQRHFIASNRNAGWSGYLDNLWIFGDLPDLRLFWHDGAKTNFPIKEHNSIDESNGSKLELVVLAMW